MSEKKIEFSQKVEEMIVHEHMEPLEALKHLCDEIGISYEEVSSFVSDSLKEKIRISVFGNDTTIEKFM